MEEDAQRSFITGWYHNWVPYNESLAKLLYQHYSLVHPCKLNKAVGSYTLVQYIIAQLALAQPASPTLCLHIQKKLFQTKLWTDF